MTTKRLLAIAGLVALFVAYVVFSGSSGTTITESAGGGGAAETTLVDDSTGSADSPGAARYSNLPTIGIYELPTEALETLDLIDQGGPYPFDRDDLVFQNREGILPDRERGHYREYTVITPGENDRGARRIVSGSNGERYYTADHYSSFAEVVYD